jgi:hypothetical protein
MADVMAGIPRSRMNSNSILGSVCSWYAHFNIAPIFADGPERSARVVRKILTRFAQMKLEAEPLGRLMAEEQSPRDQRAALKSRQIAGAI